MSSSLSVMRNPFVAVEPPSYPGRSLLTGSPARPAGISDHVLVIGTSGWQYRDWRGRLYPRELPQRLWLEHYAERFDVVEINNAFYRLPERGTFERWRE